MNATISKAQLRDQIIASLPKARYVAPSIMTFLIATLESAVLISSSLIVAWSYPGFKANIPADLYLALSVAGAVVYVIFLELMGLYQLPALLAPTRNMSRVVSCWIGVFSVLAASVFLAKAGETFSRVWLVSWFLTGLCFAMATRFFTSTALRYFNRFGQFNRHAVVIGSGIDAENAVSALRSSRDSSVNLVGFFDDRGDERSGTNIGGLKKLGNMQDLIAFVRSTRIDLLIITLPATAEDRLMQILNQLWVLPVDIRISAIGQKLRYRPRSYSYIGNLPCLDLLDRPLGDWGPYIKSLEDKIIATLALIAVSPILAILALAIKLDSKGPIFFKQNRYGFNNELIGIYKFRSMYAEAADASASRLVTRDDPRVTRVGRFIRRTSLDELPQLINVLKGELSLVGPRPHATKAKAGDQLYEHVVDGYFARHKVKPGITGWAQISGWRGETDTPDKLRHRVEHDLHYIENWSLSFDLYILAKTPFALVSSEGAY